MLTLVFGIYVSEAMVNRSLDLVLIAIETTGVYGHKFVFTHVYFTSYIYKLRYYSINANPGTQVARLPRIRCHHAPTQLTMHTTYCTNTKYSAPAQTQIGLILFHSIQSPYSGGHTAAKGFAISQNNQFI